MIRILNEVEQRPARLAGSDDAKRVAGGYAYRLKRAVGPEFREQANGKGILCCAEFTDGIGQVMGVLHPADGDEPRLVYPRALVLAEPGQLRV